MRKRIYIFVILICIMCALVSCKETGAHVSTSFKSTGVHVQSAHDKETSKEKEDLNNKSDLSFEKTYESYNDKSGIYKLPLSKKNDDELSIQQMIIKEDKLYILYENSDEQIFSIFDIKKCKVINEMTIPSGEYWHAYGILSDGKIWYVEYTDGIVKYYDKNLKRAGQKNIDFDTDKDECECDTYNNLVWIVNTEKLKVEVIDLESNLKKAYYIKDVIPNINQEDYLSSWKAAKGKFSFLLNNEAGFKGAYSISISEKMIETEKLQATATSELYSEASCYMLGDIMRVAEYDEPGVLKNITDINRNIKCFDYQNHVMFCVDEKKIKAYDCNTSKSYVILDFSNNKKKDEDFYPENMVSTSESGYSVIGYNIEDNINYVLCDFNEMTSDSFFEFKKYGDDSYLTQRINDCEKRIKMTGIDILSDEEAKEDPDGSGYNVEPASWLLDKLDAASILNNILNNFPEGMPAEINKSESKFPVEVYLSGPITSDGSPGNLKNAGGYVTHWYDGKRGDMAVRLVYDVGLKDTLETNIAHELFHIMEDRIQHVEDKIYEQKVSIQFNNELTELPIISKTTEDIILDWNHKWEEISPSDSYQYDYSAYDSGYDDENKYVYCDKDDSNVYFIDSYSKINPKEDRARIFENLYMYGIGASDGKCFNCKHIREKAKDLCLLIRAAYPSADIDTRNCWEKIFTDDEWKDIYYNSLRRHREMEKFEESIQRLAA